MEVQEQIRTPHTHRIPTAGVIFGLLEKPNVLLIKTQMLRTNRIFYRYRGSKENRIPLGVIPVRSRMSK